MPLTIADPVVVTGATGFIGKRLVTCLLDEGVTVRALVLPGDAIPIEWADRVELFRGDITEPATLAQGFAGAATVFHLAAMVGDWGPPSAHQRITVRGTENVLGEAARNDAHVILTSSVVVYGHRIGTSVCDEDSGFGKPLGPYSRSKQQQERIARRLEASRSLRVTVARPTLVFGPGSGPWVDTVVAQLESGQPCLIGDGNQVAGLTYVDNVVALLVSAAATPAAVGRIYNANDENRITWRRYFTDLAELVGAPPPKSIPHWLARGAAYAMESVYRVLRKEQRPMITHEALNLVGSNHRVPIIRARRDLGYEPRVDYDSAMSAIADDLRERDP